MKQLLVLYVFLCTMLSTYNVVAQEVDPGDSGTLLTNGVLVTIFQDGLAQIDPTGVVFDGTYYFVFRTGIPSGPKVVQLDLNFNYIAEWSLLYCRGHFINPADGEVYFKKLGT